MFGFDFFGDVDVGFHSFVVGVAGPFHDDLGRDAAREGEADEGAATCVGADEFVFGTGLLHPLAGTHDDTRDRGIESAQLAEVLEVLVHALVGDDGERLTVREFLLFILGEDGFGVFVEVDGQAVVGLLGGDVDAVADHVGALEVGHVGVTEAGEGAEAEEVAGFLQGGCVVDFLLVFLALVVVEFDFGAVGGDLEVVERQQFVFREEDDGLVDDLEFGLHLADFGVFGVAVADGPAEKPFEVEVVLLDGVLAHLAGGAQVADEFVDAFVVEVVELDAPALGGEVIAEGVPALHGAGRPLAVDALFTDEAVEVGQDVFRGLDGDHAVDGVVQLFFQLFFGGAVREFLLIVFEVLTDVGKAVVDGCAFEALGVFGLGDDALGFSVPVVRLDGDADGGDVTGLVDGDGYPDALLSGFLAHIWREVVEYGHGSSIFQTQI